MSSSSKVLSDVFADLTARHAFRKKGLVWCRKNSETLFSLELQKSNHGDQYFINLGVLFLRLEQGDHRPPHKCHFYGRFGDTRTLESLDFDIEPPEPRPATLGRFIDDELMTISAQCSTESGAVVFYSSGALSVPLVLPLARPILGLD